MFNGANPEQYHKFIASRSFIPLNVSQPTYPYHELQLSQQAVFQSQLLHQMQQSRLEGEAKEERVVRETLELEGMRSTSETMDPWLKEEVVALLTIRSSLGNEFSDFIWGHVSRKLAELGFKRSAEKCREKFQDVSKYCSSTSYDNQYRSFNELEALFEDNKMVRIHIEEGEMDANMEENSAHETLENPVEENQCAAKKPKRKNKKKKYHQLDLLKGFSEFVNKIMVHQEELHNKLLLDMEMREEERVAREEAWKKEEMEKLYKEMEIRAQDQAHAWDRVVKIIELLKQFTSQNQGLILKDEKTPKTPNPPASFSNDLQQNSYSLSRAPTSSSIVLAQAPNPKSTFHEREEYGKRWPREEVNSLINLRCSLQINAEDKESTKGPLWERISQGMLELGYKRSAKKCKEKWENINKYFRKTKDANKKRPLDSKTCPYFHQLNTIYNQGRLIMPSDGPENPSSSSSVLIPEADSENAHHQEDFSEAIMHVDGEKNMVQVPLDFEY